MLSQETNKFLLGLDRHLRERIENRLRNLAETPVPSDSKFITRDADNEKIFRYRIGDYRALYKIKEKDRIVLGEAKLLRDSKKLRFLRILVTKIDKRPRIYKH